MCGRRSCFYCSNHVLVRTHMYDLIFLSERRGRECPWKSVYNVSKTRSSCFIGPNRTYLTYTHFNYELWL